MSLKKGQSKPVISASIKELIKKGISKEQARAIAYKKARLDKNGKREK